MKHRLVQASKVLTFLSRSEEHVQGFAANLFFFPFPKVIRVYNATQDLSANSLFNLEREKFDEIYR